MNTQFWLTLSTLRATGDLEGEWHTEWTPLAFVTDTNVDQNPSLVSTDGAPVTWAAMLGKWSMSLVLCWKCFQLVSSLTETDAFCYPLFNLSKDQPPSSKWRTHEPLFIRCCGRCWGDTVETSSMYRHSVQWSASPELYCAFPPFAQSMLGRVPAALGALTRNKWWSMMDWRLVF